MMNLDGFNIVHHTTLDQSNVNPKAGAEHQKNIFGLLTFFQTKSASVLLLA